MKKHEKQAAFSMPECLEDCEGCESCCPDWKPVYLRDGKWYATHLGCSYSEIGPFPDEQEALKFQAIELCPIAYFTDEEREADYFKLPKDCIWWGGDKRYNGKRYRFARHQSGRIDPRDRWICVD